MSPVWQFELLTNFREFSECPEKANKVIPHLGVAGLDRVIVHTFKNKIKNKYPRFSKFAVGYDHEGSLTTLVSTVMWCLCCEGCHDRPPFPGGWSRHQPVYGVLPRHVAPLQSSLHRPGLCTRNVPRVLATLFEWNLFNHIGFDVSYPYSPILERSCQWKKNKASSHHKKETTVFSVSHSYVFMFTSTLHPVLHFTIIQCMEINLTVTPAAKQVTVKSCCRYVICRVSHFVLVVFLASRARTNEYFTIFQQPRRREFQNSPYFPPYVTEKNMRQTGF